MAEVGVLCKEQNQLRTERIIMMAGMVLASRQPDLHWEEMPGELLDPFSGSTVLFALYLKILL